MRIIQSDTPRPLNLLAVGPGALVAAASSAFDVPGPVEVWDAASGELHFEYTPRKSRVGPPAFLPERPVLLLGGNFSVQIIDPFAQTVESGPALILGASHITVSRDGTRLLVTELLTGQSMIECFALGPDIKKRDCIWKEESREHVIYAAPAIRPDGGLMAVTERDQTRSHPRHAIQLRDPASGEVRRRIELNPASPVKQLAFTADGAMLLARTESRTVSVFDANTGAAAGELVHRARPFVTGVAVHPRAPVACARTNGTVTLWDAGRREVLRTLDWKAGRLASVAFSPDGALGAAGTEDGKVIVWDVDF